MLAYSPYDNPPPAGARPDLLVTGAVHDPRVMVHEPAKWVAALRETDPEWSPRCLFRVETGAGSHVGPSGRLGHLAYEAEVLAWLLDRLGGRAHRPAGETCLRVKLRRSGTVSRQAAREVSSNLRGGCAGRTA